MAFVCVLALNRVTECDVAAFCRSEFALSRPGISFPVFRTVVTDTSGVTCHMFVRYSRTRGEWAVYSDNACVYSGSYEQCEEYLDFHEYQATCTPPLHPGADADTPTASRSRKWPLLGKWPSIGRE